MMVFARESSNVADRSIPTVAYAAAGEVIAPTYLKWMLCFEEPETRTRWLAKATPRDWLAPGEAPLLASNLTTRYGRVTFSIATAAAAATGDGAGYTVHASVALPPSFGSSGGAPAGGIRLRLRAPLEHAGKLSSVTVGGKAWADFNAAEETVDIAAGKITSALITEGLPHIVATFAGARVPLRASDRDAARRVVPVDPASIKHSTPHSSSPVADEAPVRVSLDRALGRSHSDTSVLMSPHQI